MGANTVHDKLNPNFLEIFLAYISFFIFLKYYFIF